MKIFMDKNYRKFYFIALLDADSSEFMRNAKPAQEKIQ